MRGFATGQGWLSTPSMVSQAAVDVCSLSLGTYLLPFQQTPGNLGFQAGGLTLLAGAFLYPSQGTK